MGKVIRFSSKTQKATDSRPSNDRLERIRMSLRKINRLMEELRQLAKEGSTYVDHGERQDI